MGFNLTQIFRTIDAERHAPLPAYGHRYFDQVLAEYRLSSPAPSPPPSYIQDIIAKHDQLEAGGDGEAGAELTWADLCLLEKYILRHQPLETLCRRAWSLRANFREIAGQKAYDAYLDSKPPNENQADLTADMLRGDLERLLDRLHWNYALVPIREAMRTRVLKVIAVTLLVLFVSTWGLLLLSANYGKTPATQIAPGTATRDGGQDLFATVLLVGFAGAVGGFVSLQRRVQTIPAEGDPLVSIFELNNGLFALYLAPLSGAIFALLLYLLFVAGMLQGALFPKVEHFPSLWLGDFRWQTPRLGGAAFAMLLVWSFVAGFAERFVPDTLTRLVERGREVSASSNTPMPPSPPFPSPSSPPRSNVPTRPNGSPPSS